MRDQKSFGEKQTNKPGNFWMLTVFPLGKLLNSGKNRNLDLKKSLILSQSSETTLSASQKSQPSKEKDYHLRPHDSVVMEPHAMQETQESWIQSLGQEDSLE